VIENFLYGQANGGLRDNASFIELGIIDSTGVLELIGFLEQHFGIALAPSELIPENLDTIQNLTNLVERKLALQAAVPQVPENKGWMAGGHQEAVHER